MKRIIEIGLLFSRQGDYARLSETSRNGAVKAIKDVNQNPDLNIEFIPVERDPKSNIDLYASMCRELLNTTKVRHVFGCITSSSRKEVIPDLERTGGTLWYSAPYEGFEVSDHVAYIHGCPNQHLLPLLNWTVSKFGREGYLAGSNYIWGWEMNRVARSTIVERGGAVLGERYLPIGDVDVERIISEIKATRPNFILNSLIAESSYAFLRAYKELGKTDPYFTPQNCPVLSCNFTEAEFDAVGDAAEGLISAGPYFVGSNQWGQHNARSFNSSFEAATYNAVTILANLLNQCPDVEQAKLSDLLMLPNANRSQISRETHHIKLPVLIAQVQNGKFEILKNWGLVEADPYLSRGDAIMEHIPPKLTVV